MIYITDAEQVRRLLPSPLHKNGTQVQQCRICNGRRKVLVKLKGLPGEFGWKRCKACRGKKR